MNTITAGNEQAIIEGWSPAGRTGVTVRIRRMKLRGSKKAKPEVAQLCYRGGHFTSWPKKWGADLRWKAERTLLVLIDET